MLPLYTSYGADQAKGRQKDVRRADHDIHLNILTPLVKRYHASLPCADSTRQGFDSLTVYAALPEAFSFGLGVPQLSEHGADVEEDGEWRGTVCHTTSEVE
jgi:hypothetical protein